MLLSFIWSLATGALLQTPLLQKKNVIEHELSEYIQELVDDYSVPGLTLGLVSPGGHVEHHAWGIRTEEGESMTTDTMFYLASCSKAFTATGLGLVIDDFENGRNATSLPSGLDTLNWKSKLAKVLPDDWKLLDPIASEKANILDILSHSSGLPRHDFAYSTKDHPAKMVRRLRHLKPTAELREAWQYNNHMFAVASHIISTYTKDFYQHMRERVFHPLGMNSTTYWQSEVLNFGKKITETWSGSERLIPLFTSDDKVDVLAGAGGIISNVHDMTNWLQELLKLGKDRQSAIPRNTFTNITQAYSLVSGVPMYTEKLSIAGYGAGWIRFSYQGHEALWHTGGAPGVSTSVLFLPHDDIGIVILTNTDRKASVTNAIQWRIVEKVLALEHGPWDELLKEDDPEDLEPTKPSDVPLSTFVGTYTTPGYDQVLTLCAPETSSAHCARVRKEYLSVHPPDTNTLISRIDSFWGSHMAFRHAGDGIFNVSVSKVFPEGYGKNTSAFVAYASHFRRARFIVRDGKVDGLAMNIERPSESLEEDKAEVVFHRRQ